ncbi:MAG: DUF6340 family protein [Bacteroidales bacterium]|nr:DUF6340 family protein [Bacteroidales bacterium]
MKRLKFISAVSALALLGACSPEIYEFPVQMRTPSDSGYDFSGKTISVVYVDKGLPSDSTFTKNVADGFALKLEEDYFNGEQGVNFYTIPYSEGAKYSDRDTLVNLVMDTGDDVIVLLESPRFGSIIKDQNSGVWNVPFQVSFNIYDSMSKLDTVKTYVGKSDFSGGTGKDVVSIWENSKEPAVNVGYLAANKFSPNWQEEVQYLYSYSGEYKWDEALEAASMFKWDEAMAKWIELADTNKILRRACATFNLAVGCYFLQEYDLALEWLDQSDADSKLQFSSQLRRKIINRKTYR